MTSSEGEPENPREDRGGQGTADEVFPGWSMPQIRLALLGGVSRERAADLVRKIREAYPHVDPQPPAAD